MKRALMKGNDAIGEGAIRSGCRYFFGYPITPQSEVTHYMAKRLPEVGGVYLQAESEVASINMIYGAAGAGARVMTSSSGPGMSLMQEGISFLSGAELPCVIVNIMRGGPGLGNIAPSQSDYFQATRGGGHGDYRNVVFAPNSVQEILDIMGKSFEVADKYRNPVMVLADGILGQMIEPVDLGEHTDVELPDKPWAANGNTGRGGRNVINSVYTIPEELEKHNLKLGEKYAAIERVEQLHENYLTEDAEIIVVAFGIVSRICKAAVEKVRQQGMPAGLIRPVTLWPFPAQNISEVVDRAKCVLTVELNMGQMIDDVRLAVNGKAPVYHYGRVGGMVPSVRDVVEEIRKIYNRG